MAWSQNFFGTLSVDCRIGLCGTLYLDPGVNLPGYHKDLLMPARPQLSAADFTLTPTQTLTRPPVVTLSKHDVTLPRFSGQKQSSGVKPLELYRAEIVQGRVEALAILPAFDVLEDRRARLGCPPNRGKVSWCVSQKALLVHW